MHQSGSAAIQLLTRAEALVHPDKDDVLRYCERIVDKDSRICNALEAMWRIARREQREKEKRRRR
jgi:hypothetical protein